jgi:hypothetical protein
VKKVGEYIVKDYAHSKNMRLWAQRDLDFVLQQPINKPLEKGIERWYISNLYFTFLCMVAPC